MDNPAEESNAYARIQPRDAIREFARVLSHLRGLLFILLSTYIVLSIVMYYVGGAVDAVTRAPASLSQVAYFCAITALTIGYGDVIPITGVGRFVAVLLGFQGVLITGLVTAAQRSMAFRRRRTARVSGRGSSGRTGKQHFGTAAWHGRRFSISTAAISGRAAFRERRNAFVGVACQ